MKQMNKPCCGRTGAISFARLTARRNASRSMKRQLRQQAVNNWWSVGDKAEHKKWGIGTVVSVKGEGEGKELDIAFPVQQVLNDCLQNLPQLTKSVI